ncbi:unnamed protein product [Caenorhabditis angaria]|uniref:Uncharacterized protein n=1 Tax=Caenorhabditis angaria TaxID=860376 RepID=A0A9P1MSZ2_9PELO|nr:unnamed protein product [Caenorhabditis angaria]
MIPARKSALTVVFGKMKVADQLNLVKNMNVDRETKDALRQCFIASMNYQSTSKENLEKSKTLIRKTNGICEISSRSAAFTAGSALKLKRWKDFDEVLPFTICCPPVIQNSLKIMGLAQQLKFDEALNELENVLMLEEIVFGTENYCVSDQALDILCDEIKKAEDSIEKMKRFRNLQRIVTKYNRRTTKTIDDLLFSPLRINSSSTISQSSSLPSEFLNSQKFQDFVKDIPYQK